jgi:hypothetical protein
MLLDGLGWLCCSAHGERKSWTPFTEKVEDIRKPWNTLNLIVHGCKVEWTLGGNASGLTTHLCGSAMPRGVENRHQATCDGSAFDLKLSLSDAMREV